MSRQADTPSLDDLRQGGKRSLAQALALIETAAGRPAMVDLLEAADLDPKAHVLGVTGPPGVGKSTLLSALIRRFRSRGDTVGVIAVDPSSHRSGGALLGDRLRIDTDPTDQGTFVRSMAARDRLGGLASITAAAMVLMRAVFDRVLVETVGVGQSETDIKDIADTVLLAVQPGSGDSLQYMKAGIAEIPDIAVVSKADQGERARKAKGDLEAALLATGLASGSGEAAWQVPVLAVSALDGRGIDELFAAIDGHAAYLDGLHLRARRAAQADAWLIGGIKEAFGRKGIMQARSIPGGLERRAGQSVFRRLAEITALLDR